MSQQLHKAGELCALLPSDAKDGNLHEFLNFKRGLTETLHLAVFSWVSASRVCSVPGFFGVFFFFLQTVGLGEGHYCCFLTLSL